MTFSLSIHLSILFLVTCITPRIVIGEQRFVEKPPLYEEVSAGEDVQLRCIVFNKRGDCAWQKDSKPVRFQTGKYELLSHNNECTLLIRRASLEYDDGFWECQVTSSDFTRQDALSTEQSRLLVKVKPKKPQLIYQGTNLGSVLSLREGENINISCVSRYGNPAALIKWYIGNKEVIPSEEQNNSTEVDSKKTWAAHSVLRMRGQRENHGLPIRCETRHPSSVTPDSTESLLDIYYLPEVRLETDQQPFTAAPEDSVNTFSLKCIADANPTVSIKWYKDSMPLETSSAKVSPLIRDQTTQLNGSMWNAELRFDPVKAHDAGLYVCKAENIIGESAPASYRLDVQYRPKLKTLYRNDTPVEETVLLGSSVEPFECPKFDGNPSAQYRWVHLRGGATEIIENHVQNKGGGRRLRLDNIMWSDEGEYRCIAFNTINGFKRETASDKRYVLHVTGPPEIQARPLPNNKDLYESIGWAAEPVHRLKSRFCSRPPPKLVAWQWGSAHIRAGETIHPKYEALPLEPIIENKMVTNCYWAKLEIKDLQKEDARTYTLLVESEKGRDSTKIRLIVKDPTEIRVIAAAVAIGLLFLLLLISISVYSLLKVRRARYRKEEEEGSIAADALYSNGSSIDRPKSISSSHVKTYAKSNLDSSHGVYDYSHIVKQTHAMSPEALKVRRAPVVLQPPTIV